MQGSEARVLVAASGREGVADDVQAHDARRPGAPDGGVVADQAIALAEFMRWSAAVLIVAMIVMVYLAAWVIYCVVRYIQRSRL